MTQNNNDRKPPATLTIPLSRLENIVMYIDKILISKHSDGAFPVSKIEHLINDLHDVIEQQMAIHHSDCQSLEYLRKLDAQVACYPGTVRILCGEILEGSKKKKDKKKARKAISIMEDTNIRVLMEVPDEEWLVHSNNNISRVSSDGTYMGVFSEDYHTARAMSESIKNRQEQISPVIKISNSLFKKLELFEKGIDFKGGSGNVPFTFLDQLKALFLDIIERQEEIVNTRYQCSQAKKRIDLFNEGMKEVEHMLNAKFKWRKL
jgi:hypothetical protein